MKALLFATIALALAAPACTTGPDGKQTFDWQKATTAASGIIGVVNATQNAPAPPAPAYVGPFTATK